MGAPTMGVDAISHWIVYYIAVPTNTQTPKMTHPWLCTALSPCHSWLILVTLKTFSKGLILFTRLRDLHAFFMTWHVQSLSPPGHSQWGHPDSAARRPLQNDQSGAGHQPWTIRGRDLLQAGILHVHICKHTDYRSSLFLVFLGFFFKFRYKQWAINSSG